MLVVGAKGFAIEIAELIYQVDENLDISFYDDINVEPPVLFNGKHQILKNKAQAREYFDNKDRRFVLGIGNPALRFKCYKDFQELGGEVTTLLSPLAVIGKSQNQIGAGTSILSNVVVEGHNQIGKGCLIHVGCFISHNVLIGDFCEISPFSKLLGNVSIGDFCQLGTSCVILPKVKLGNNVIVGAGAVVTKSVPDNTTVVGIPAKPLLKNG